MESSLPSCSKDIEENISEDIVDELKLLEGINVRTELQEVLEKQALHEINNFNKNIEDKEDGEISDTDKNEATENKIEKKQKTIEIEKSKNTVALDIGSYIKRQEELKKRQQFKRSLEISDKSREAASKVSKKHKENSKKAMKRKKRDNFGGGGSKIGSFAGKVSKNDIDNNEVDLSSSSVIEKQTSVAKVKKNTSDDEYIPSEDELEMSDPDYVPDNNLEDDITLPREKSKKSANKIIYSKIFDDGSAQCYKTRLAEYYEKLEAEQKLLGVEFIENEEDIEVYKKLKINKKIWNNLYSYQQEGVEWLYELHIKASGGILGDEMGLGKTVQIIAFLNALNCSKLIDKGYKGLGPTIIVCPATVIHQWVQHFHEWAPEFRVAILHQSGSFTGNKTVLIKEINKDRGILITSYSGILKYKGILNDLNWHYVILDEGHKIRNSNAKVSIAAKEFRTPHRIMLTGSPMQNNLQELWSLFDFTNPGMLGSLQIFMDHFAHPILQGGYANATYMQESLALSMASALRDLIIPHLLRRSKQEVRIDIALPNKTEQVLFCSLTPEQRDLYKGYLMGEHVGAILGRGAKNWFSENTTRANVLVAITTLRKICNHPDLYLDQEDFQGIQQGELAEDEKMGFYKKSGKMVVISALLKIWKQQKHRVLLFTQSRGMILIFEEFLTQQGYTYLKMDGSTSIRSRQPIIDKFNSDISYDVFLLTTRVGGLGVNLTGANRVVIYDPDWNPATDTQARERAWRIGQERNVTIYRLISAGTIEEKIYQRQVWKQLLSNKILVDPKTQRFFKSSDLHDLFSLHEQTEENQIETANIFKNSRVSMEKRLKDKKKSKSSKNTSKIQFSDEKLKMMKELAAKISKSLNTTQPKVDKTLEQLDLEEEQNERRIRKEQLKKLTAPELHLLNREKSQMKIEDPINKVDEIETEVSFDKALEITEQTAQLYHEIKHNRNKEGEIVSKYSKLTENIEKPTKQSKESPKKQKKKNCAEFIDQPIEGLLKSETKKIKLRTVAVDKPEKQDQYVLDKLFSKKGISSALQHDVIVQSGTQQKNVSHLKIHTETKIQTDLALAALRKSKLTNWRW